MKYLHMVAFLLVIVGALNWLLFAVMGWEIGALIGGMDSMMAKVVYGLVGVSGIYLVATHKKECAVCKSAPKQDVAGAAQPGM